jgi:YafQ family addiction module toxin component
LKKHNFMIEEKLEKIFSKLYKKDKVSYEAIMKKMDEIISCDSIEHYKNLKKPLEDFRRVHINTQFVLVFKHIVAEDKILFFDYDHHDVIYNKLSRIIRK